MTNKEQNIESVQGNGVLPVVMPSFDSSKNWVSDYNQENGNYTCKCYKCKELFFGNKHRILCKECYDKGSLLNQKNNG